MNRVVLRADGNAQIGMGHVMRCLALSHMLRDEFLLQFAIKEPEAYVCTLIQQAGLCVVPLPESTADTTFLELINTDDIVVLDGYAFDISFQKQIRNRTKRLIYIDDLLKGHQVADVVINHAGGIRTNEYDAEPYTKFYLGPHYALLRPEFLQPQGFGSAIRGGPFFVSMGGADLQNMSLHILEAIRLVDPMLPIHIVLGPFHPNRQSIEAYSLQLPNLVILQNQNVNEMVRELQQCSLALTSCSTIAYEVCAVNRPLIAIVTADNQARIAQFLSEEQLAVSVSFPALLPHSTPRPALAQMLKLTIQSFQLFSDITLKSLASQKRFFDGQSPERFRKLFQQLSVNKA
ncbi:UDP-2,4-diacetamido-2,4,6-trideoxy-beta-L-altropyranose hydrolase [Spirosoma sp. SC4-14]|uniref:UDP-2,4-diacetamido-2,4, 6-trideoxy-beta-L-altropyranose hydrolase n=1 Tax=Spirosoma sp. SC4-14 TaxID=3128900 RepID=UPI0030D0C9ED